MLNFVHLRLHTEFSITDSILRVKDVTKQAKANNMYALGISDTQNMFALVKFYKACRDAGIKPIVGVDLFIEGAEFNYQVLVIAKNITGYRQICELITRSYTENKINDTPYVKEQWLVDFGKEHNIILLSGFANGDIGQLITQKQQIQASNKASFWHEIFADNYFLELQRSNIYDDVNQQVRETLFIADRLGICVVATHPVQFSKESDYTLHEIRVCVASGDKLDDDKRQSHFCEDQYFKSQQEMNQLFADIPSAIVNTLRIAEKCNLELTLGQNFLPDFATGSSQSLDSYLEMLAYDGLVSRMVELFPNEAERVNNQQTYQDRLAIEVATIVQMGFSGYFLIVADFISWAKEHDIPVGPGRGSGAGSLVAFSLGITDVDPLRYNLLFERFLNPERVSMPDFDIDFCQEKRELVIEYVKDKYGVDAVAQIATFGTMTSKAVIKDVGRVLGLPYGLCDSISKLISNTPGKSWSLLEAYDEFPELKSRIDDADDDLKRLWDMSLGLENITRNVGKHAAGVLIAPTKLSDFCPLYLADGMQTSQLDKDDVEQIGLVKFDFLGLRNLTIIQEALENIQYLTGNKVILSNFDFEDQNVYKLLQAGNTTAIFQLESQGMKKLLVKIEPDRFEDIIAVLALYRPGPLGSGMVDDFIKRKKGEQEIDYFHNDLMECLDPTYGVIVYQEQVMQISQTIGGYTLGGADLLRRAMGKKKPEEMAKHRDMFVEGALAKGYTANLAEKLFDLMAMFAEYGFNKSHTAAYAVVSYHTAYLKTYYKSCFMAATLSSEMNDTDKLYEFYQDCLNNKINMLHPDINQSEYRFLPIDENTIRYALGALKGVGQHVVEMIVLERKTNGAFASLMDFCKRMDKKVINKKTMESLIYSGAFDSLEPNRHELVANLPKIITFVDQIKSNENQGSLFDDLEDDIVNEDITLDSYPAFELREQLKYEKLALGFYLTASLFDEYRHVINQLNVKPLKSLDKDNEEMQVIMNTRKPTKQKVLVSGVINYMGSRPMKSGGVMSFVRIEDELGELEVVLYNEEFEQFKHLLKIDELVFIDGTIMYDSFRDQIKVTVHNVYTIDEILKQQVKQVNLTINSQDDWNYTKSYIDQSLESSIRINIRFTNDIAGCFLTLGSEYSFSSFSFETLKSLAKNISNDNIQLVVE